MRELKHKDIYKISKILRKMDMKKEIQKLYKDGSGKTEEERQRMLEDLKAEMLLMFMENIEKAETEINDFMGDLIGINGEEFADLPIKESMDYFAQLFNLEDAHAFFKMAAQ